MARSRVTNPPPDAAAGLAFLLSQVGAHSSARFADRLEPLGLKPAHAGILRVIREADGLSQQALGDRLGMFASRLVAVLDELERLGLVERRDNPSDRRSYALYLTEAGRRALEQIERVGREHQDALCAALDESERAQLAGLLGRIAAQQGLTPGIHPGYRSYGGESPCAPAGTSSEDPTRARGATRDRGRAKPRGGRGPVRASTEEGRDDAVAEGH